MPAPIMANTVSAAAVLWVNAKPSAAPMKGAVQGEATSAASTPDSSASAVGCLSVAPATPLGSTLPNSNTPDKLRPITKNSSASSVTTSGDCN